jgi:hypothetical protein
MSLLTAGCGDSTSSDGRPERTSKAVPAGPIAVVGNAGFFVSDDDGETIVNRVSQDGTIDSVGPVPVEGSVGIQGAGDRLLITGLHQERPEGCTSDDCGMRQFRALWVAPDGDLVASTTLLERPGGVQDSDSVAVIGVSSDRAWFAVPGATVTTDLDGSGREEHPAIQGVACVFGEDLVVFSALPGEVSGATVTVTYRASSWPAGTLISTSPTYSVPTAGSFTCGDQQARLVDSAGVPVVTYDAERGWSMPTVDAASIADVAESSPGGPLLALDRSGQVLRWLSDRFEPTDVRFSAEQAGSSSLYAGAAPTAVAGCLVIADDRPSDSTPTLRAVCEVA